VLQVPAPHLNPDPQSPVPSPQSPKYFICALARIFIGIPAQQTERIISVTRKQDAPRETENNEVFISLPALLKQKETAAPHGIVLKRIASQPPDAPRTTLLTPKIDAELEIPTEEIRGLPKVLGGSYKNFRGAYCDGQKVILILNPEKLLEGAL